jgi:hypothetical protein
VLAADLAKGAGWVINLAIDERALRRPARRRPPASASSAPVGPAGCCLDSFPSPAQCYPPVRWPSKPGWRRVTAPGGPDAGVVAAMPGRGVRRQVLRCGGESRARIAAMATSFLVANSRCAGDGPMVPLLLHDGFAELRAATCRLMLLRNSSSSGGVAGVPAFMTEWASRRLRRRACNAGRHVCRRSRSDNRKLRAAWQASNAGGPTVLPGNVDRDEPGWRAGHAVPHRQAAFGRVRCWIQPSGEAWCARLGAVESSACA